MARRRAAAFVGNPYRTDQHGFAPTRGFVLQVDSGDDPSAAIDETLALLGLTRDALLWLSPLMTSRD